MKKFMLCIMGSLIALFVVFWFCISYTVKLQEDNLRIHLFRRMENTN